MSTTPGLIAAAQAVVDRWDSPKWEEHTLDYINRLRAALESQPQAVPADWPTNEMIEAGKRAAQSHGPLLGNGQSLWHVFRDMFAAAPQPTRNFCPTCGKRIGGPEHVHTCTPPDGVLDGT